MLQQQDHPQLPRATHDEGALQDFARSLKHHLATKVLPGNREVYESEVLPAFTRENGRAPRDRHEVRRVMDDHPYYRLWGSLQRASQEMNWNAVADSVARQRDALNALARSWTNPRGSLTLDATVAVPNYLAAVDIHCMPGNYHGECGPDDVSAGALYDRGVFLYAMGGFGALNDLMGREMGAWLRERFPDLAPRRILDMGCTVGNSTLPYVDAFPDAEVHAIDVAAPCLRYGHSRAEALGRAVHFRQANAEATPYPDGHFDLIVSHILLHETSNTAIRRIMRECRRLLAPGGVCAHVDLALYEGMDPFDAYMLSWDTYNNNEPFWSAFREMRADALMTEAGFAPDEAFTARIARPGGRSTAFADGRNAGGRRHWQVIGARRAA